MKVILYIIIFVITLTSCRSQKIIDKRESPIIYKSYNFEQGRGVIELKDGAIIHIPHQYYFILKKGMLVEYVVKNNEVVKVITNDFTYKIK